VTEGAALTSNDQLSVALVSQVLGTLPGVEYSATQPASKLYSAAASAVADHNFAVRISIFETIRHFIWHHWNTVPLNLAITDHNFVVRITTECAEKSRPTVMDAHFL